MGVGGSGSGVHHQLLGPHSVDQRGGKGGTVTERRFEQSGSYKHVVFISRDKYMSCVPIHVEGDGCVSRLWVIISR